MLFATMIQQLRSLARPKRVRRLRSRCQPTLDGEGSEAIQFEGRTLTAGGLFRGPGFGSGSLGLNAASISNALGEVDSFFWFDPSFTAAIAMAAKGFNDLIFTANSSGIAEAYILDNPTGVGASTEFIGSHTHSESLVEKTGLNQNVLGFPNWQGGFFTATNVTSGDISNDGLFPLVYAPTEPTEWLRVDFSVTFASPGLGNDTNAGANMVLNTNELIWVAVNNPQPFNAPPAPWDMVGLEIMIPAAAQNLSIFAPEEIQPPSQVNTPGGLFIDVTPFGADFGPDVIAPTHIRVLYDLPPIVFGAEFNSLLVSGIWGDIDGGSAQSNNPFFNWTLSVSAL